MDAYRKELKSSVLEVNFQVQLSWVNNVSLKLSPFKIHHVVFTSLPSKETFKWGFTVFIILLYWTVYCWPAVISPLRERKVVMWKRSWQQPWMKEDGYPGVFLNM
jgi:hypothetical protein